MPKCKSCGHDVLGITLVDGAFYWVKYNEDDPWTIERAHYFDDRHWYFYDTFGSENPAEEYNVIGDRIMKTTKKR
jgi:hypothetical protein